MNPSVIHCCHHNAGLVVQKNLNHLDHLDLDYLDAQVDLSVSLSAIAQGEFLQDSANLLLEVDKSDGGLGRQAGIGVARSF